MSILLCLGFEKSIAIGTLAVIKRLYSDKLYNVYIYLYQQTDERRKNITQ